MPKNKDIACDADKPAFEDAALGFVYKSLITRDPNKRRIKPVESILSFDPDLDDSESDDSDYKPTNVEDDDVEIESDADVENENKKDDKGEKLCKKKDKDGGSEGNGKNDNSEDSDELDSSSDSSSEDHSDNDQDEKRVALNQPHQSCTTDDTLFNGELLLSKTNHIEENGIESLGKLDPLKRQQSHNNLKKILVCCVCLGELSRNEDEIVECDSCGISVHELCYGITADDAESIHSNASSASTEPWFCDPCKAGIKSPLCELCPNTGGIYKITDAGRWVHMVCALYTHGVTFADVEKLRGPTLSALSYNRWGAKSCSLCDDERYSLTGLCVCCDAGMCKTYFHVTCAQREGLLCAQQTDEVDPYIVYCKLHSDRNAAKVKRRNYLALMAKNRLLTKSMQNGIAIEDCITNQRTLSKLFSQRKKFAKNLHEIEHMSNVQQKRIPKLLDSSPSALRRLSNKGQLLGINNVNRSNFFGLEDLADIRRKWHIQPAFSIEFISYYLDRNDRILLLQAQSQELIRQNKQLKDIETKIRSKYDHMVNLNDKIKRENEAFRVKIRRYLTTLGFLAKPSPDQKLESTAESNIPEEEKRSKLLKMGKTILEKSEMHAPKTKQAMSTHASSLQTYYNQTISSKSRCVKASREESFSKVINIKECATCSQTKDQHSLALCDSCHLYYHLYCLDPPLRRMPKKNRFGGWQCSNCTEKEQEENEQNENSLDMDMLSTLQSSQVESPTGVENASRSAARKLRENPKLALKYEEEMNSLSILSNSNTSTGLCVATTSRGRPRGRSAGTGTGRRGRRPKSSAAVVNVGNQTQPATGRKRKLSITSNETLEILPTIKTGSSSLESPTTDVNTSLSSPSNATSTAILHASVTSPPADAANASGKLYSPGTSKKPPTSEICNGCKKEAQLKLCVRCDNCQSMYHFACLIPPCGKSPKRRGYTWCCFICEKKNGEKRDHSNVYTSNENVSNKSSEKSVSTKQVSISSKINTSNSEPMEIDSSVECLQDTNSSAQFQSETSKDETVCIPAACPVENTKLDDKIKSPIISKDENETCLTTDLKNGHVNASNVENPAKLTRTPFDNVEFEVTDAQEKSSSSSEMNRTISEVKLECQSPKNGLNAEKDNSVQPPQAS